MLSNRIFLFCLLSLICSGFAKGQPVQVQKGMCYKTATSIRLGSVQILNKHTAFIAKSNIYGDFSIPAYPGDTLEISCAGYNRTTFVVTDLSDKVLFLDPVISLPEVVIKETSVQADLNSVKRGYRKKSVFYTGTPHYYYLILKPMTFIYENFKSEVINARKFNRYAKNEMAYYEIASRFNDISIKSSIPIKDDELEDFKAAYWPPLEQVKSWNDYDLSRYIIRSYQDFKKKKSSSKLIGNPLYFFA
jgi:hypothetical protein